MAALESWRGSRGPVCLHKAKENTGCGKGGGDLFCLFYDSILLTSSILKAIYIKSMYISLSTGTHSEVILLHKYMCNLIACVLSTCMCNAMYHHV